MVEQHNIDQIDAGIQRAYHLIRAGKFKEATIIGNNFIKRYRDDARGWNLLCEINRERGALMEAAYCAEQAARLTPEIPNYHIQYGRCLVLAGRRGAAIAAADKASQLNPDKAILLDALGSIYSLADEQAKALPFYEQAVEQEADNPDFLYNLAACQRMQGDLQAAERNCNRVIELKPQHYEAYYVRSDLNTWSDKNNHIAELESLLLNGINDPSGEIYIRFALAKEAEDIRDYDKSFKFRKSACDLLRHSMHYDVDGDVGVIDRIIQTHTREALDRAAIGYSNGEPIFILGLPRTGTTLVERIISSHSSVYAAGELNEFAFALLKTAKDLPGRQKLSKLELVDLSLSLELKQLGETYINSTRPRTGHTPHFTDKLPLNYLYCGLIKAALPKAKIILLDRNPMDACYAVYKTLFTLPYPFSYDLDDLGKYYVAYRRLTDHWRDTLGETLLVVNYEELVNNQEEQSRRIIEFCGLLWEDACLAFHKHSAASSTASAVQVRQPIYTSSIGQWRHYEKQLQPLVKRFKENGIEIE